MPALSIHLHADGVPTLETSDDAIVEAVRSSLDPVASQLVMARDLAAILKPYRKHWAAILEREEEAHMVRVVLS